MRDRLLKIAICVMPLLAAPCVSAAPVKVTELGGAAYYVVTESVVDAKLFRRTAVVHDYAEPETGGVRSRRVVYDVDCAGERLRSVSATEHAEPMAQGKTLNAWERESDWLYVAPPTGSNITPRSPYRAIVRFVCSK